jgi:transcription elongation factor GreA
MARSEPARDGPSMTHTSTRTPQSPAESAVPPPTHGVTLSRADFSRLAGELDRLRTAHRADLAERLRDARSFGSPGDDDDWLTVMEDATVEQGRIAQLERLVAVATVADDAPGGDAGAGLGCLVRVRDENGRTVEYQLTGTHAPQHDGFSASLGSPVGKALLGARAGDLVRVELPSGRARSLRVIEVRSAETLLRAAA